MKKILRKIMAIAAAVTLVSAFASCSGSGEDDSDDVSDKKPAQSGIWTGAEMIDELAGKSTSWDEEINISKALASRIQVGSKVIFEIDINGEYAKFMVASGWSDCKTTKYYSSKDNEVPVKENADNPGVYETLDGLEKGTYYFNVTSENVEILKNGFAIRGNFTLVKIGITNLGEATANPDAAIKLVKPADKDRYKTFWAQSSGVAAGTVNFILNYESAVLDKAVKLSDVVITYIINDSEAKEYTADSIEIPKNAYGTDYQVKVPVFADYKVTKNDAIYIKISAKVNDEKAAGIIQGNLIDTDASVNYWKEMCIDEQQKQILSGITYAAAPEETPAAKETVLEVFSGSQTINWAENGLVIDHGKFTADFNALRITYNAASGALKMAVCDPWTDITATSTSDGSIAADGAVNLPTGDAQTVTLGLSAEAVAGIKGQNTDGAWGGVKIFGADTITITKVEAVKVN